jgi:hypothetical protein
MASRTYLPHLVFILKLVCRYMQRYETQIKGHLGGGSTEAAFDAALAACQILVPLIEALIPPAS